MANITNSNLKVAPHTQDISSINGLETRLAAIETSAGSADEEIEALGGRLDTAEQDIESLEGRMDSAEADIADRYTKAQVDSAISTAISSVYRYKGSVEDFEDLASISNPVVGDVYNVVNAHGETPAGTNYAWTGSIWDALGGTNDLTNYFNKTSDTADDITEGSSHLFLTTAERTKLGNTSGVNTGDQSASDFDIKDLADSTNLRDEWSGKQDAISDLANIRSRAEGSIQASDATFVSNTISENASTGVLTATAADNVTVADAESNNKAAIAAIATAHNNLVSRVEAVEAGDDEKSMFAQVTMNGTSAEFSDSFVTAASFVQHTVVGEPAGYIYKEVEAGKVTVKSTEAETNLTVYLLIMKNPLAS